MRRVFHLDFVFVFTFTIAGLLSGTTQAKDMAKRTGLTDVKFATDVKHIGLTDVKLAR